MLHASCVLTVCLPVVDALCCSQFHDTLEEARQEGEELAVEVRKLRQLEQMNQSLQESLGLRVSNAQRSANLHTSPSMGPKAEKGMSQATYQVLEAVLLWSRSLSTTAHCGACTQMTVLYAWNAGRHCQLLLHAVMFTFCSSNLHASNHDPLVACRAPLFCSAAPYFCSAAPLTQW
jgi:hypothetical protein